MCNNNNNNNTKINESQSGLKRNLSIYHICPLKGIIFLICVYIAALQGFWGVDVMEVGGGEALQAPYTLKSP